MKIVLPSAFAPIAAGDRMAPPFYQFLGDIWRAVTGVKPGIRLASFTVATLPDAAENARGLIYVSDGTSNKRLAVSDGTNWRFPDGNIVS